MPIIKKDNGPLFTEGFNLPLINWLPSSGGGGGGGGGGRGGGSVSSGSSSSGGSRGGSSSGSSSRGGSTSSGKSGSVGYRPPGSSGGTIPSSSRSTVGTSYGNGYTAGTVGIYGSATTANGIPRSVVPQYYNFSGRPIGGLGREGIYGSGRYGSGYGGGYSSRGLLAGGTTRGFGFPFIYWPLTYPGYGDAGYYGSGEYNQTGRPGGRIKSSLLLTPVDVVQASNNFVLYGDDNSVVVVRKHLATACGTSDAEPKFAINPNQAVQYYRASSFALLLEGYNNSQPLDAPADNATAINVPLTPLPTSVNMTYFNCLNSTLGQYLPLPYEGVDGSYVTNTENAARRVAGEPILALQAAWAAMLLVVLMQLVG